jgi:hypothetical protein
VSGAEPPAVATPRTPAEHADKRSMLLWDVIRYLAAQQLRELEGERARLQAIVDRARGHLRGR